MADLLSRRRKQQEFDAELGSGEHDINFNQQASTASQLNQNKWPREGAGGCSGLILGAQFPGTGVPGGSARGSEPQGCPAGTSPACAQHSLGCERSTARLSHRSFSLVRNHSFPPPGLTQAARGMLKFEKPYHRSVVAQREGKKLFL